MERVGAYISHLQQQYQQQAEKSALIITAQMLLAELQKEELKSPVSGKVAVVLPYKSNAAVTTISKPVHNETEEKYESVAEPLKSAAEPEKNEVPEVTVVKTPELETEPIPEIKEDLPVEVLPPVAAEIPAPEPQPVSPAPTNKPLQTNIAFNAVEDVPTLMQHQPKVVYELNQQMAANDEQVSFNDKLKNESKELAHKLQGEPIRDLKKAIGINDRYLFLNELFRGDETMYERSIKTINNFNILPEAEYWMQRELKYKLGWDDKSATVQHFNQLVKRRFS